MFKRKPKNILLYNDANLDYDRATDLLGQVWTLLEDKKIQIPNIKIVYSIASELLENVYKYSDFNEKKKYVLFEIQETNSKEFKIVVSNPVERGKAQILRDKIEFVKSLSKVGLKKLYQYEIKRNKDDDHSGAGLGLIIIARKIIDPIKLELIPISEKTTIVTITVKISFKNYDKN